MAVLDVEKIINATPQKRLINAYNSMKKNYNEATAQEYLNAYKDGSLSFLFENSRMIFSEPYFGFDFYKEAVTDLSLCHFTVLENEKEKVEDFIEENRDKMSSNQLEMYESLRNEMNDILDHTKKSRLYANYIADERMLPMYEEALSDALYAYKKSSTKDESEIISALESGDNITNLVYLPYINEAISIPSYMKETVNELANSEITVDLPHWQSYVERVICCNKLSHDSAYKEAVSNIGNKMNRVVFEYFMNTSILDQTNKLLLETVSNDDVNIVSGDTTVNNAFFNLFGLSSEVLESAEEKLHNTEYEDAVYNETFRVLFREYQECEDTSEIAEGYTLFEKDMSIDEIAKLASTSFFDQEMITEDEDVSDDDVQNMETSVNTNDQAVNTGKKPQAPKASLANRIQNKAMDNEAKFYSKKAIRQQKGQERKNAFKAVAAIPNHIMNSIRDQIHMLDEKDDERRERYIKAPGFRKKAFRNLKLAILYGGAASVKLAYVPVVALCRHFSKKKDIRIQNMLVRELNTEIKVCDEKISDAQSSGDNAEKYRLIRIREQLDAEMVRVKTNSKYI